MVLPPALPPGLCPEPARGGGAAYSAFRLSCLSLIDLRKLSFFISGGVVVKREKGFVENT